MSVGAGPVAAGILRQPLSSDELTDANHLTDHRTFIPAIDGLRGLAIIGVLLFHLGFSHCSLGWSGVELFFVISGFLITRILLDTRENESGYFKTFYYRRALRIFPIYYIVLIGYMAFMIVYKEDIHFMPFYFLYLQTIPMIQSKFTYAGFLGHTWTLAIEEQFYFVWPILVWLLNTRRLFFVTIAMVIAGLCLRIVALSFSNPFLIDGWLGVQVDVLGAGAMIACGLRLSDRHTIQRWLIAAFVLGTGSLLILVSFVGLSRFWTPYLWGRSWYGPLVISAMACTFGGMVGLSAIGHRWTRILEFPPLLAWGKISYGIYVFHPFIFWFLVPEILEHLVHYNNRILSDVLKLSFAYAVAWLSWRLIEGPINRLKYRNSHRRTLALNA